MLRKHAKLKNASWNNFKTKFYRAFLRFNPSCYTADDDKNDIAVSRAQCLESFSMGAGISRLPLSPLFSQLGLINASQT